MSALIELFRASTALYGGNTAFIEDLYERYLQDPESVDLAWRVRFDALYLGVADEVLQGPVRRNFLWLAQKSRDRALVCSTEPRRRPRSKRRSCG